MSKTLFSSGLLIASIAFYGSFGAAADDTSTTTVNSNSVKATDVGATHANDVPNANNVDDIITNANLRAMSGSKSRWSVSNAINFDGGAVDQPFGQGRPNIAAASSTSVDSDINDQLNVKYSINPVNAILVGFGIRQMAPFAGQGTSQKFKSEGGKDTDAYDPSVTYQYVYKMGGIQSVLQVGLVQFTRSDIHSPTYNNQDKGFSVDQENMYEIGNWSIGASVGFSGNTPTDSSQEYSRYQYWVSPYVEYRLNDTYNLRTVSNCWSDEILNQGGFYRDQFTQSVGLGIAITRDFFLYPNVQFLPQQIASDLTNFGVAATINLF